MLGLLTGGWAADWYGWGAAFLLGSAVGTIGLAASFFIVEKFDDNSQKITVSGVLEVAGDRVLLVVSGLAILSQVLTFATAFGFTPVYAHELGASKLDMGLLTFFSNLPAAFASLIGGSLLVNKIGERRIIVYGFLCMGLFTVCIPFIHSLPLLMASQALSGVGRGVSFPVLMALSIRHMPSNKKATAMGFFQAIYGLGMFLGPVFLGWVGDFFNLNEGFMAIGLLGCATALLSQVLIKHFLIVKNVVSFR
jgi:MFS family permease